MIKITHINRWNNTKKESALDEIKMFGAKEPYIQI